MKRIIVYIHGKGGNAKEALHYKSLFKKEAVVGLDYKANDPWTAKEEFPALFDKVTKGYDSVIVIANSIGAYFTMQALGSKKIQKFLFISPIVDMQRVIRGLMNAANVTEEELEEKKTIETSFGETLSIDYLNYVRENPVVWRKETHVLYGENDTFTSFQSMIFFCERVGASLNVMEEGEHYFHTEEQMKVVDEWVKSIIQ